MGYEFDPELAALLEFMPPFTIEDVPAAREAFSAVMAGTPADLPGPELLRTVDRTIPGPPGAPDVRVRVYTPVGAGHHRCSLPAVLYLHSGGWVFGSLDAEHLPAAAVAVEVGALVVSVEYRLAPEDPYPAAVQDGYAALEWLAAAGPELGVDPGRIAVMGSSAGGGLAAALTLMTRDRTGPRIAFQVLNVPVLDDRLRTASMAAYTDTPVWNRPNAELSWRHYLRGTQGEIPPYAAPARAGDLSGLPPAYVAVAQFDPLRDEGIEYAQRLLQQGIPTELHCFPGTFHGATLTPSAGVSQRQVAQMHEALRLALAS